MLPEGLGPAVELGRSERVVVHRVAAGIAKVFLDERTASHEAQLLEQLALLPLRTPRLLERQVVDGERWLLLLEDVREGLDARIRRLDPEQLSSGVTLLATLHTSSVRLRGADAWATRLARASRDARLPEALRTRLSELPALGDAVCHGDLHPSNWLTRDGVPLGLMDWASAVRADPEWDLAGLVHACGGDPSLVEPACAAWAEATGRPADRARTHLYVWLQLEEALVRRPGKARLEALRGPVEQAARRATGAHGTTRRERVVPEASTHAFWVEVQAPTADTLTQQLRDARVLPADVGSLGLERYGGHACNDVVRFGLAGTPAVLKIYNKPVAPWLFPLERYLARTMRGPIRIQAPLELPTGGDLFRIDGRPAALYPDAGRQRLSNALRDVVRLAEAQAALHTVPGLAERFPQLQGPQPRLDLGSMRRAADGLLPIEVLERVERLWAPYAEQEEAWDATLPRALVHGSLNRDHTAILDEELVVFDLEKARLGPAVLDAACTASYVAYRGNDEQLDPGRFVLFFRSYHRCRPLDRAERVAIVPLFLRQLVHDVKAIAQETRSATALERHVGVLFEVAHNQHHLQAALDRELDAS